MVFQIRYWFWFVVDTKVIWMSMPVNGEFALIFLYGIYVITGKVPCFDEEELLQKAA